MKKGARSINYCKGFDKWEVYRALNDLDNIQPHLPITMKYRRDKDLIDMLKNHPSLYLKACRGRRGYHVMRVARFDDASYEYSYFTMDDGVMTGKTNLHSLLKVVHNFFQGSPFIIQQAIDLHSIDKKIMDMRAEVQRNGYGELEYTSISVRISKKNAPITTHGDCYRLEDFFTKHMNYSQEQIIALRNRVEDFLSALYRGIEKSYGPTGEMGIDFALDKKNHIWFIESNNQPTKASLIKAYDRKTIEKAFLNPLEYAKYLVMKMDSLANPFNLPVARALESATPLLT
ncbi:YheC/YheD family protein [Heliorestis convoluta]|uniref:YheC/YheD family protein n=1 Tax=Heliorestis convoluta TaxID=356322 RepID=A0A5Q2N1A3_9FIRM|nr:YheC/YheD family protein [Heliorestis convoluta]QGG48577.1 YheC/YheD family protein [Heliorestis convoluta]